MRLRGHPVQQETRVAQVLQKAIEAVFQPTLQGEKHRCTGPTKHFKAIGKLDPRMAVQGLVDAVGAENHVDTTIVQQLGRIFCIPLQGHRSDRPSDAINEGPLLRPLHKICTTEALHLHTACVWALTSEPPEGQGVFIEMQLLDRCLVSQLGQRTLVVRVRGFDVQATSIFAAHNLPDALRPATRRSVVLDGAHHVGQVGNGDIRPQ
mmetsp:Transcript_40722/g.103655  ORF Transcript_40722/g.103655 Transcript_40722/m.103655 type:complete len:207 (+) Transcript_40722:154-774(+)